MQLDVNLFFSNRLIFSNGSLQVTNSIWDWIRRVISWVWSPASYSEENRRTIICFKKYLVDTLGASRLHRITSRYCLDLDAMAANGNPLLSRDVAKIVVGVKDVTVDDINDTLQASAFNHLSRFGFARIYCELSKKLDWEVPDIKNEISGAPTERVASIWYDRFLADRERLEVSRENSTDTNELFVHNMVARVIKREMDVGTLIPAPNHSDGSAQFYYVAAKIITAEGMVSYIIKPATEDTSLAPMRVFRGTSPRSSDIDAISTAITDLEYDLGKSAYLSGVKYEPFLREKGLLAQIEAGHSLGSTIVQYRLANLDHIKKAYLFCGPGLPSDELEKFNQKNPFVKLIIRRTKGDFLTSLGKIHIGYQAPDHVHVAFCKFHGHAKARVNPHVVVWGRSQHLYGIEGGLTSERQNSELYNKYNFQEILRSAFGPPIAEILRLVRFVSRSIVSSRADELRGVQYGEFVGGRWRVEHYRGI